MPNKRTSKPARKHNGLSSGATALGPVSIADLAASRPSRVETKYNDNGTENVQLYHGASNGTTTNALTTNQYLTAFPNQGVGVTGRIGDRCFLREIPVRLWLSQKSDRPNCLFRVCALLIPAQVTGNSAAWSTYFSGSNCITAQPKIDVCTLLYDKVINPDMNANTVLPSPSVNKERSHFHSFTLTINKEVSINQYNLIDHANIMLFVVAYDAYGTIATDNIASYAWSSRVYYTDS